MESLRFHILKAETKVLCFFCARKFGILPAISETGGEGGRRVDEREVQRMNARKKYRILVSALLVLSVMLTAGAGMAALKRQIPDHMTVRERGEAPVFFSGLIGNWIETKVEESMESSETSGEKYEILYSLFGRIPLKTASASVAESQTVYVGGAPVGIYLDTKGVYVVDTGMIQTAAGESRCPAKGSVKRGDYIEQVNGKEIATKEELVECISTSGGKEVELGLRRDEQKVSCTVLPVEDDTGTYRAGIWARNNTQGIGTLTYVDEEGHFGALGHGISDIDTGELLEITDGVLYDADVLSVVKGTQGSPGELSGIIHYKEGYRIGVIEENNSNGIYGTISGFPLLAEHLTKYETANRQEVTTGKASILCFAGGTTRAFEIEIEELRMNGKNINKGMVLRVTDPGLLELTGGIVQGMSGSPILQNGRIVGAVTHVFVNNPEKGYGIFIEDML